MGNGKSRGGGGGSPPPLKPAELEVLLALAGGERHGYGIRKDAEARSGGKVRLGPGALYRALDGLLGRGLVEEAGTEGGTESGEGRRRRYYRITGEGREAAAAEARRLEAIVSRARETGILGPGAGPATGRA